MIRNQGLGHGYNAGFGDEFSDLDGNGYGCGEGTGTGTGYGDGYGYDTGAGTGYGYGGGYIGSGSVWDDPVYITTLIIDSDPLTTAYQAQTMQTTGDHHV